MSAGVRQTILAGVAVGLAILALFALCERHPTRPASAQSVMEPSGGGSGGGITAGASDLNWGIPPEPSKHVATYYYSGSALVDGWTLFNSTGGTFTLTDAGAFVKMTIGSTAPRSALLWELVEARNWLDHTHDEAARVLFNLRDVDAIVSMGAEGIIQLAVGDTGFVLRDKIPDGFGFVILGTNVDWAGVPNNEWLAYVGNGADTTYVSTGIDATGMSKLFINATPNGGPVYFYVDDVLKATISAPVRSSNTDTHGVAIWMRNDGTDFWSTLLLGPIVVDREWD